MEGYCKDEKCNRDGCEGIIEERDIDGGCSCHTNPPCSYCTEPRCYCPKCEWDEKEERDREDEKQAKYWADYHKRPDVIEENKRKEEERKLFYDMLWQRVPVDKFRAIHRGHTHFSQIIIGVHPNMTQSEVREKVKGTFGGRFTKFNSYSFEYVAYTD